MNFDWSMRASPLELARVARALSDPRRLALLRFIARGEISCQELTDRIGLAQATVSHHLKVLSEAGLISARRDGSFHWYRLLPQGFTAHAAAVVRLAPRPVAKPPRPKGIHGKRPRPTESPSPLPAKKGTSP